MSRAFFFSRETIPEYATPDAAGTRSAPILQALPHPAEKFGIHQSGKRRENVLLPDSTTHVVLRA